MWDLEKILTVSAAWVQAVGSIVALYVAFIVANRQAKRDDRRREQEHREWRESLLALANEMLTMLRSASRAFEPGNNFITTFDPAYPNKLVEMFYTKMKSDRMAANDIAPAMRVIACYKLSMDEFTSNYRNLTGNIETLRRLERVADEQIPIVEREIAAIRNTTVR